MCMKVYCPRKFRPLSNIRLCYTDNLYLKGVFRWRNAEDSLLSLKQKLCLRPLRGESSQAELCRRHNLSENQVSTVLKTDVGDIAYPDLITPTHLKRLEVILPGLRPSVEWVV